MMFMKLHKPVQMDLRLLQVQKRQELYGLNRLNEVKGEPVWLKFIKNFTSMMALLLWAGGAVAFFSGTIELGIAIWLVNVINGLFSFFQEYRASQATEALKRCSLHTPESSVMVGRVRF